MRHVATLIAGAIIAPLSWILLSFGQDRSAQAFANAQNAGAFATADFVRPLEYLAAAGLLLGLIATLRFSPLGASFVGAGYAASYAFLLVAPERVLRLFGDGVSVAGRHADTTMPIRTGTTLLLGVLLLVSVASVGRWRRWPRPAGDEPEADQEKDRPLGADGLDLFLPGRAVEPENALRLPSRPRRSDRVEPDWTWAGTRR